MSIGVQFTRRPFTALIIIAGVMLAMAYTTVGKGAAEPGPFRREENGD